MRATILVFRWRIFETFCLAYYSPRMSSFNY